MKSKPFQYRGMASKDLVVELKQTIVQDAVKDSHTEGKQVAEAI